MVEVIQKGDLLKSLRSLRELQPWNAPLLLSHLYRWVYVTHVLSIYIYVMSIWPPADLNMSSILNIMLFFLYRLYEKHGEVAVRAYPQFYPTILPSDIMAMALPSHFLPYLDNLVQSRAEQQRYGCVSLYSVLWCLFIIVVKVINEPFIPCDVSLFLNISNKLFLSSARLSFLGSLLQPETLRQDWLKLALSHDAPQKDDTLTADGQPRYKKQFIRN